MNQTFNLKRFGRYLVGYAKQRKIYLAVMTLLFIVPASILSVKHIEEASPAILSFGLTIMALMTVTPDDSLRHLLPETSLVEKFTNEVLLRLLFVAIPFGVHGFFAFSIADGAKSLFTDGFQPEYLAFLWITMWLTTMVALARIEHIIEKVIFAFETWSLVILFADKFLFDDNNPDSTWHGTIILLNTGLCFFCTAYPIFKKRFDDYNKSDKINED